MLLFSLAKETSRHHAVKLAAADAVRPALAFPHTLHHGFVALLGSELVAEWMLARRKRAVFL
jgi:hypothetical protein